VAWPFDDDEVFMPVRDGGDPGGTQERVMLGAVGDLSGILRREDDNLDGTTTTLFTRRGRPVFETSTARSRATEVLYRGFVAKNPQTGYAVLFDPYTLTILRSSFSPAKPSYYVQNFATTWGVPPADATNWYDVAMFDGTAVKINAKAMPTLQVVANHSFPAIPYVIERSDPANRYGGPDQNNTEKRVFAVGRADVKAWGGAGATETLTPTDPRTEDRCLTIGQRVDYATDKTWLGQLYYPATGWDGTGEWYFTGAAVTMLLTAPYLSKVASNANVAMSPPTLVSAGTSSGSISTDVTLPDTPVGMTGVAELRQDTPYDGGRGATVVVWGFDTQISRPLQGERSGSYSRLTYTGSQSSTETQAGVALDYSGTNTKYWDARSERYTIKAQSVPMADAPTSTYTYMGMGATTTDIFYVVPPGDIHPRRYKTQRYVSGGGAYPDLYHSRDYEVQTAAFSVSTPLFDLVSVSIYRESSFGQLVQLSPNMTYYPPYFGPYYYHETGMGVGGRIELNYQWYPGGDITPVIDYYKQNPSPPPNQLPAVIAEVEALRTAMRDAHMAAIYYDDESSSGYTERPYGGGAFYHASVNPSVDLLSQTLEWSTKDFILHDTTNGVYISIEGAFSASGHPATGTLTVTAKVETRHHTTTIQLGQWSYTYTELLPEREIGSTGKYAVPSPQIRAIFAPLYQEQGSFHGAHYVTADEESNGADPFHGFNFLLRLGTYGDFSTCNENNAENKDVYFVPCNLLEMLYAFVFSTEMGVAESGDRYPVTYASRYTQLVNELFIAHRISVSDGVQANWTDQLGPQFSSISNTTLHRV
jgi:hypothetical protein